MRKLGVLMELWTSVIYYHSLYSTFLIYSEKWSTESIVSIEYCFETVVRLPSNNSFDRVLFLFQSLENP